MESLTITLTPVQAKLVMREIRHALMERDPQWLHAREAKYLNQALARLEAATAAAAYEASQAEQRQTSATSSA